MEPYMSVTTRSRSEAGIGSDFGSEQSYQILEEGNRIGLGFNLCVVPTRMICRMSYNFGQSSETRVEQRSNKGQTEVGV